MRYRNIPSEERRKPNMALRFGNRADMGFVIPMENDADAAVVDISGDSAQLFLYDEIDAFWGIGAMDVRAALTDVVSRTPPVRNLLVRINSPGGEVMESTAIMSLLRDSSLRVDTQVDGGAFSAAGYILQSGTLRRMNQGAVLQMHRPSSGLFGNATELRGRADELEQLERVITGVYAARSGADEAAVEALLRGEDGADGTFLTAERALELGLVDEVVPLVDGPGQSAPQVPAPRDAEQMNRLPDWVRALTAENPPPIPPDPEKTQAAARTMLAKLVLRE